MGEFEREREREREMVGNLWKNKKGGKSTYWLNNM